MKCQAFNPQQVDQTPIQTMVTDFLMMQGSLVPCPLSAAAGATLTTRVAQLLETVVYSIVTMIALRGERFDYIYLYATRNIFQGNRQRV